MFFDVNYIYNNLYIPWYNFLWEKNDNWINLGYWKNGCSYNDACENLLEMMCINFNENDIVLDVGCGFGKSTYIIKEKYNVKKIIGINICENQLKIAKKNENENIIFRNENAIKMNFCNNNEFSKIIALECLHHFDRIKFLKNHMKN